MVMRAAFQIFCPPPTSRSAVRPPRPSARRMAVEKLKEGIDNFAADQRKLEDLIAAAVSA